MDEAVVYICLAQFQVKLSAKPSKKLCERGPKTRATYMLLITLVKPFCMHTIFQDLKLLQLPQESSVQLTQHGHCLQKIMMGKVQDDALKKRERKLRNWKSPLTAHMGCYLQLRSVLLPQEQVTRALYPRMTRGIRARKALSVTPAWLRLQFLTCSRICGQQHKECLQTYPLFFTSVKNCPGQLILTPRKIPFFSRFDG